MKLSGMVVTVFAVAASVAFADPATDQQVTYYGDAAVKAVQAMEKAKQEARSSATSYQQMAGIRVRQKLATSDPVYQAATDDLAAARRALEQALTLNNPALINNANSQISQLTASIEKLETDAAAVDVDIVAAKTMLAMIDGKPAPLFSAGQTSTPPPAQAPSIPLPRPGAASANVAASTDGSVERAPRPHVTVLTYPSGTHLNGEAIGRLIHGGWDAVMSQQYDDALTMFNRAIGADTRDAVALLGRGIAQYEIKEYKTASKDLEKAYSISMGSTHLSRQLVVATAATAMVSGNPMRAVKLIEDQMKATAKNGAIDEELLNDLGTALSHVDSQARLLQVYDEALRYYIACDKEMDEKKADGTARWGTTWIDSGSASQKWQTYRTAAASADQATVAFQHAGMVVMRANDHYQEITGGLRLHTTWEVQTYTQELKDAAALQIAAQSTMNTANAQLQRVEKPPFPDRIEYDWSEPR